MVDETTIELADAASTDVSDVEVILNDPGRVGLSNHARRRVENRTVDLGDRTIDDGSMEIGGRGLVSATARFSSLDLGKEVTIVEAGLFVSAIASFDDNTQVTLDAPAPRGVSGVLADVFNTDSRPGLEQLLAALGSLEVEATEVRFGPGVYDFTRIPDLSNDMNAAIGLQDLRNLTFRGEGPGVTILRLMPNQQLTGPDTHVIETRDCHNLTFVDLSVHGAYLTMGNTNEQMHGINLNEGSREIVVERVRVFQSAGDGIRFLGAPDNKVSRVWVDNCQFVQNKRSGIGFQRAAELVWIQNCYIEMSPPSTDSCIDFEPTGDSAPTDVLIGSNVIVHQTRGVAVAISGISGDDPTRRVSFVDNIVLGGSIFSVDVDQLIVRDNVVLVPADGPSRIPVHVQRGGDSIIIAGNLLVSEPAETQAVISVSEVNQRKVRRSIISGNLCFAASQRDRSHLQRGCDGGIEPGSCDRSGHKRLGGALGRVRSQRNRLTKQRHRCRGRRLMGDRDSGHRSGGPAGSQPHRVGELDPGCQRGNQVPGERLSRTAGLFAEPDRRRCGIAVGRSDAASAAGGAGRRSSEPRRLRARLWHGPVSGGAGRPQ